jgi:hypothetical protein
MRRALHDAEQSLFAVDRRVMFRRAPRVLRRALQLVETQARTRRPTRREFQRDARLLVRRFARRALVKDHHDLRAERGLHLHRNFRRQKTRAPVNVRTKLHALFFQLPERAETPHLKAARIRQQRPLPTREAMQPAARGDHLRPRTQPQMICVPQNDPRVEFR